MYRASRYIICCRQVFLLTEDVRSFCLIQHLCIIQCKLFALLFLDNIQGFFILMSAVFF